MIIKKIIIYYLNKEIRRLSAEEESIEINQDIIDNPNGEWQEIREYKIAMKKVVKFLTFFH